MFCAAEVIAQPTFGRPKQSRPKLTDDQPSQPPPIDETATPNDWTDADPPRVDPSPDAAPGVWHTAKTQDGFRYAWSYPAKFEKTKAYNLVIILHPENSDFRWGMNAHTRGTGGQGQRNFRENDIVVSIDGVTANPKRPSLRTFEVSKENAMKFRDVVLELSRTLPTQRIYLYGKGEGGAFAAAFVTAFPALAEGVVCHASELPENALHASSCPIVLVHGAKDQFVPLSTSAKALDDLEAGGHTQARLRVLRSFNDFTNQSQIDLAIESIEAVRNQDGAEALASVERLLTPRGGDEYGYRTAPWYAASYGALKRITTTKDPKFTTAPDKATIARAEVLMKAIDDEAAAHVQRLRELIGPGDARTLALDGGPWLGYLIAFRDDFRGVPNAEALFRDLAWELVYPQHAEVARSFGEAWTSDETDTQKFVAATESLPNCFLVESLPVDLLARARVCMRKADELDVPQSARDRFEFVTLWEQGWRTGLTEYEKRWSKWRPPKREASPEDQPNSEGQEKPADSATEKP
jgi:pimeloyl-ACP methyl ester carboxylesterase